MIFPEFNIEGKTAVVTGGAGVLCSTMCRALAGCGVQVAVLDVNQDNAQALALELRQNGQSAMAVACDVLDRNSVEKAAQVVLQQFGQVDILINGAGGNRPAATRCR